MAKTRELVCNNPACGKTFTDVRAHGRIPKRCPECREKDPKGHDRAYDKHNKESSNLKRHRTVATLSDGDKAQLDFIKEYLGESQSGSITAAIRAYAVMLQRIKDA